MPPRPGVPDLASCDPDLVVHASCVAAGGCAVLIKGPSGSGKSGLALQLMGMGAGLVADDRTNLWRVGDGIWADAPATIRGRIEAREVGILTAKPQGPAQVVLMVDLESEEQDRLPPERSGVLIGIPLPLVRKSHLPHFPAAVLTYLLGTRDA